jgi:salicylate hydroxylase
MLYNLAVSSGASVIFNSAVSSVFVEDDRPHVVLATGEVLNADVVVGADGYRSIVRDVVSQREDDGVDSGMSAYTCLNRSL